MKKKITVFVLAAVMICTLFITGCGEKYVKIPYSDYDLSAMIALNDYHGFQLDEPEIVVTEEDIQAEIDKILDTYKTTREVTEGTVNVGDKINISFEGVLEDGTTDPGMKSDKYLMILGLTSMIDGFSEAIYGATIGETIVADLRFPDPYVNNMELSGKKVTFTIKVLNKIEETLDEFNDEFVKKNTKYKSVEKWKEATADLIAYEKTAELKQMGMESIYEYVTDGLSADSFEVIEEIAEEEAALTDEYYRIMAKAYDMEWDAFLTENGFQSQQEYDDYITAVSREVTRGDMVLFAIVQASGLKVAQKDYDLFKTNVLESSGISAEDFEETMGMSFEKYFHITGYEASYFAETALAKIYDELKG